MATFTVSIPKELKKKMDAMPEINWAQYLKKRLESEKKHIKKDDGMEISAQYLNDIEHDRRNPPSEKIIEQFAEELKLDKDVLCLIAGTVPKDVQNLSKENPEKAKDFFKAFRRDLK